MCSSDLHHRLRRYQLGGDFGNNGLLITQIETHVQPPKMMLGYCTATGPPASHRFEHGVRSLELITAVIATAAIDTTKLARARHLRWEDLVQPSLFNGCCLRGIRPNGL